MTPKPSTHHEARLLIFYAMMLSERVPDEFWKYAEELRNSDESQSAEKSKLSPGDDDGATEDMG